MIWTEVPSSVSDLVSDLQVGNQAGMWTAGLGFVCFFFLFVFFPERLIDCGQVAASLKYFQTGSGYLLFRESSESTS